MKLKIKISGPKVHDVGYRYFLMSMAMANRIRMFEAHNTESSDGEEVLVFVDGEEDAVKGFLTLVRAKRPARSEVSGIFSDGFEGEVMKIGEYAQFCSTVQLNKAIPLLLDIRDDMKEIKVDIKEVKVDPKEIKTDITEIKTDVQENEWRYKCSAEEYSSHSRGNQRHEGRHSTGIWDDLGAGRCSSDKGTPGNAVGCVFVASKFLPGTSTKLAASLAPEPEAEKSSGYAEKI